MSSAARKPISPALYEADLALWADAQAEALLAHRTTELDWQNLAEEIASVGRSEKREIARRLTRLMQHLLKWEYQASRRTHSWQSTISGQRLHIGGIIETSPSLRGYPEEVMGTAYGSARRLASDETGVPLDSFPADPPYRVEDVLRQGFMPGEPWSPDKLIRD